MAKTIVFDGICCLCEHSIRWIKKYAIDGQFEYVPLQSEKGYQLRQRYLLNVEEIDTVLLICDREVFERSDAFFEIVRELNAWPRRFYFLRHMPKPVRDGVYNFIAQHRYKIFGRRKQCYLP